MNNFNDIGGIIAMKENVFIYFLIKFLEKEMDFLSVV